MSDAYFSIPLNLPHAGTISLRIEQRISDKLPGLGESDAGREALMLARKLVDLLARYRADGENPADEEAKSVTRRAAGLAMMLVNSIEAATGLPDDRLGQHVRNLFECLEMGREGAQLALRAGENPNSAQRPT